MALIAGSLLAVQASAAPAANIQKKENPMQGGLHAGFKS